MYLCYIDESGTADVPGTTSHFILAGISLPIWHWRDADREVSDILSRYDLSGEELHTAWILRSYVEQQHIPNFSQLSRGERRVAVERERNRQILESRQSQNRKSYRQQKKNFAHTKVVCPLDARRTSPTDIGCCGLCLWMGILASVRRVCR